ncbi:MAG: selenium metabolism-associated LysR family transcriptional regulator [Pseudomonadota bacterium]|nr:selenium metabolism-associated LysR family transcriptional regulator [Pseudomonadota bacterium]
MIEMRQIQVFLAVSELLNFSRAAEKIHLTQPTVSGHLKTLEKYLKVQLVERGGKEVRLTPAGELFHPFAQRIFTLQERARREISLYTGAERGSLEIGGSNTPGQYILPKMIGLFTARHKQVKITLKIGDSNAIITQVADGKLELGLVGTPAPETEFISKRCLGDELILVANPKTALKLSNPIDFNELKKLPFIIREKGSGTRQVMQSALQKRGMESLDTLNLVAEMGSAEAIRQALKSDLGVAIVSSLSVAEDLGSGKLTKIMLPEESIQRYFYLIYNRDRRLSPLAEALSQFILQDQDGLQRH